MSLTEKLYWRDMYLKEFDASVEAVNGNRIVLDQTAFSPRGGGLVSDSGTLAGMIVTEVLREGEEIVHVVKPSMEVRPGALVHGVLDWDRRHKIMRMHTTAHILSAVVNRETGALITGNQISPDKSRVDFNLDNFDKQKIFSYIERVNEVVGKGLEVKTYFMKREEALANTGFVKLANAMPPSVDMLRIVQIGDVDTQADGGVHVKNTIEIGNVIGIGTENKGKNNRRLYFTVE